ncbi:hypothetical protein HOLleu_20970 [Holothuria leucospilota]|uniref:HYR domain-containing protein n=1 Tax=Holothuria leucospilota TaxID=206669 RepID=A0A9Q1BWU3_HOLLE|nr:hypothetical protein HOLleu_20970 [Holothuria leucospilota]
MTVTCTCTDSCQDTDSCTFIVNVDGFLSENTPPTITCPPPVTVISLPGNIGNIATYNPPQCIDAEDNQNQLQTSCSKPSGAFFQGVGPMTVTCTCTDSYQDTDSCTFNIFKCLCFLSENTPPTIICPPPVTMISLPGNIGNIATYNPPQCFDAEDNQNQLQTSCSQPSGAFFQGVGPMTVTCTCTDSCQDTDSCTFIVNIDGEGQSLSLTLTQHVTLKNICSRRDVLRLEKVFKR